MKERHHIPRSIMNHPPSNYGDAPPAYLNHDTGSYLSDPESPTNASRLNGATMRLLPSGDGADDLASSYRAPSPSHYDPDYEHTPYVLPNPLSTLSVFTFQWSPSRQNHVHHPKSNSFIGVRERLGENLVSSAIAGQSHCCWARANSFHAVWLIILPVNIVYLTLPVYCLPFHPNPTSTSTLALFLPSSRQNGTSSKTKI